MHRRRLAFPSLVAFVVALAAAAAPGCGSSGGGAGVDDVDDARDVSDTADTEPDGPPPVPAEFGLDARPSNATCLATDLRPPAAGEVALERLWPGVALTAPILALQAPDDAAHWFVVERHGRIVRLAADPNGAEVHEVADLGSRIDDEPGEAGLLGMAFHPDFAQNREVYLSYTRPDPLTSRFSRVRFDDATATLDMASEEILLEVEQPFGNHNGGHIAFGPDRRLYIALGDGGSGGDPLDSGQDTATLLGAILRLEVDGDARPYGIPPDNPFADGGGRPEIFAWGLRNPWRFSFDRATGELWAGDVGQNAVEEIDLIERGGNYGWRVREGTQCYEAETCEGPFIDPVVEHLQSDGERSITGGYVYRGTTLEGFAGTYIYGDFVSGRIFAIERDAEGRASPRLLLASGLGISSFAEGLDGELLVVDYGGSLHRIVEAAPATPTGFPTRLSQTGCVDPDAPNQPAAGLVPYAPTAELWSDGAHKRRWMALPDGEALTVTADGDLDFPVGSVLVKQFERGGQPIETRLVMRHPDGWAGYTYAWEADGSDALLLDGSERRTLADGSSWYFPGRGECAVCHTAAAGFALGPEVAQLNADLVYAETNRRANQLATLEHIGLVELGAEPSALPALADPHGEGALDARARSYLHANCGNCHRPGGRTPSAMDLRFETALSATAACDVAPGSHTLGLDDPRLVAPGAPTRSVLLERMATTGFLRMPPLARDLVDEAGVALVRDWIDALEGCD